MIDFACKKFDIGEVIRCSLNLTRKEFKIVQYLMKHSKEKFTPKDISKIFKMGLSTSQKAIKKLYDEKLLKRSQKNLEKGGYIFVYSIKEKNLLKKKILEILDHWMENVRGGIKRW